MRLSNESLSKVAGTWQESEPSDLLDALIPPGNHILLGDTWPSSKDCAVRSRCFLCAKFIAIDIRDPRGVGITELCTTCFFTMQEGGEDASHCH